LFVAKVGTIILRPGDVLNFISGLYENKPVLLCVDELMKSPDPPKVLTAIGACLNQLKDFDAVVTTLNLSPFSNLATSARPIKLVWFSPIEFDNAVKLFENLTLKFQNPNEEIKLSALLARMPERRTTIEACISDCNGHARTLETLATLFLHRPSFTRAEPYIKIQDELGDLLASKFDGVSYEMITLALAGNKIDRMTKVITKEGPKTFEECIKKGWYLNSLTFQDSNVIPTLSPIILAIFARIRADRRDP